jgi:hypothetical protein
VLVEGCSRKNLLVSIGSGEERKMYPTAASIAFWHQDFIREATCTRESVPFVIYVPMPAMLISFCSVFEKQRATYVDNSELFQGHSISKSFPGE